jgi:hypothetical protein
LSVPVPGGRHGAIDHVRFDKGFVSLDIHD